MNGNIALSNPKAGKKDAVATGLLFVNDDHSSRKAQNPMSEDLNNTALGTPTDVRQRLADRLGFLLAKRWIRIQQQRELRREENQSPCGESKPPKLSM